MIRTLIAEDVPLVRGGLVAFLSQEPDIEIIAALDRGDYVLPAVIERRPNVVVLSSGLPGSDGFAVASDLSVTLSSCGTLIIADRPDVAGVRRAIAVHAQGFMAKDTAPEHIANAIRRIAAGGKVIDPDLAFATLNAVGNPLTARELDVLRLAAEGAPAPEIAQTLCLSVGTVRNYLSRVNAKTGARNRVDAIRIAGNAGWL